ncbi:MULTISPECIES: hypothetical protein [Photorhabdus]|uniref:Uncharacterized protein n=2 Tax=Photorhabdus TaxID=29487 RepID=A0ABX0B4B0_9GAMM|nr:MULTISPECIES: hypothetical protein [Photorhabdus]MCT8342986.1 hypothetical protein [Photorhabdus kleinii]MCC8374004.1 hypothetical protein [Photorhabdus bodei]MCC8464153.1 hypothetical protein [Photorhabdus bodei]MCT8350810.1 hypothetical protein [Photorhabdus kayaii]MDB6366654.1 hypothetical protein [Photorhabdus bodei]
MKNLDKKIDFTNPYALLARDDKGKMDVKVLSEDAIVSPSKKGNAIEVINSLKKRLLYYSRFV